MGKGDKVKALAIKDYQSCLVRTTLQRISNYDDLPLATC